MLAAYWQASSFAEDRPLRCRELMKVTTLAPLPVAPCCGEERSGSSRACIQAQLQAGNAELVNWPAFIKNPSEILREAPHAGKHGNSIGCLPT